MNTKMTEACSRYFGIAMAIFAAVCAAAYLLAKYHASTQIMGIAHQGVIVTLVIAVVAGIAWALARFLDPIFDSIEIMLRKPKPPESS